MSIDDHKKVFMYLECAYTFFYIRKMKAFLCFFKYYECILNKVMLFFFLADLSYLEVMITLTAICMNHPFFFR